MISYDSIRRQIYNEQVPRWSLPRAVRSPYTYFKTIYYIESAAAFLFFTQGVVKRPNFITLLYILTGVFGAFFILVDDVIYFMVGVFMVFTKGTFDWADGPLARRIGRTSLLGHVLDVYGAYITDVAFRLAFVYYTLLAYPTALGWFPIIAFILMVTKLNFFADIIVSQVAPANEPSKLADRQLSLRSEDNSKRLKIWYFRFESFLDARARSVDSLLLLLLLNYIYDNRFSLLLLVVSGLILFRAVVLHFAATFYSFQLFKRNP